MLKQMVKDALATFKKIPLYVKEGVALTNCCDRRTHNNHNANLWTDANLAVRINTSTNVMLRMSTGFC